MYAGLGETVSERAGIINLGTEGSMLVGALGAYAVGVETGNPWLGALAGAGCGGAAVAAPRLPRRTPWSQPVRRPA